MRRGLDRRHLLGGIAVLAVLGLLAAQTGYLSVLGDNDQSPPILSYCGSPDWFDQFQDQHGYVPNQQCTGVDVAGYRIDVDRSSYDGSWGCYSQYTVYNHTASGLDKLQETAMTDNHESIDLPGLTIKPQVEDRFANWDCQYIGTEYRVTTPGQVQFTAEGDTDVTRGENATVTVSMYNSFREQVTGTLDVEFCAPGPFAQSTCIDRTTEVTMQPQAYTEAAFTIPTDRVHGNITITPTLAGEVAVTGDWQGVNWDCDGDGTLEPVSDCTSFDLDQSTGDTLQVTVGDPSIQEQAGTLFDRIVERVGQLLHRLGI